MLEGYIYLIKKAIKKEALSKAEYTSWNHRTAVYSEVNASLQGYLLVQHQESF